VRVLGAAQVTSGIQTAVVVSAVKKALRMVPAINRDIQNVCANLTLLAKTVTPARRDFSTTQNARVRPQNILAVHRLDIINRFCI